MILPLTAGVPLPKIYPKSCRTTRICSTGLETYCEFIYFSFNKTQACCKILETGIKPVLFLPVEHRS